MKELFSFIFHRFVSLVVIASFIIPIFLPWKQMDVFSAARENEYSLAVIFVEENLYSGELAGKIDRYAQDVQNSYNETKSLIIPVSENANSEEVYRILENFYFEGQREGENIFFLKGVILIGNVIMPELVSSQGAMPSIFPYTDFENPTFIWDSEYKKWVENPEASFANSEIWHGVIPGSSDQLLKFFDRNHEIHQKLENGELPTKDEVLFWDSASEAKSGLPILVGQYERGIDVMGDRKGYKYDKEFLESLYQNYISDELFSTENIDLKAELFPAGKKIFLDSVVSIKDIFRESFWRDQPDRYLKDSIEELLPSYAETVKRYETDSQDFIKNTGRWDQSTTDTVPEMISVMDEWVANEIKKINKSAEDGAFNALRKMDAGALMVPTGYIKRFIPAAHDNENDQDVKIPLNNYYYGKKVSDISEPQQCTIYRGSMFYANQYKDKEYEEWRNEKKNNPFSNDEGLLFHADPLSTTPSQEVEYSTFYDSSLFVDDGDDPILKTKKLGGCTLINALSPEKCDVHKAIEPVFSWVGGHKVITEGEILYNKREVQNFPLSEVSGMMCERFNFNDDIYSPLWNSYQANPLYKVKNTLSPILYTKIDTILKQGHPLEDGEKSLDNVVSQPLAKSIAVNRVPYIDFQTGDPALRKHVRANVPDFFRYQYKKKSEDPVRTQYELSQLAMVNDKKLVGGNSVYNRKIQPKNSSGIATQSAALRFQRIIQFKDGKMKTSEVFPVPDDEGKIPLDYENEILSGIQNRLSGNSSADLIDELRNQQILYASEYREKLMNIKEEHLKPYIEEEVDRFLPESWEYKLIQKLANNPSLVESVQSKISQSQSSPYGLSVNPKKYYLHDIASDDNGFSEIDGALNKYLVPQSQISDTTFSGIEWQITPISQEFSPSWASFSSDELPEEEGELYLEIFEVLATGNDVFDEIVPVGGRSFLGLRKNASDEVKTDFYAEVTGNSLRDHNIETKEILTTEEAQLIAQSNAETGQAKLVLVGEDAQSMIQLCLLSMNGDDGAGVEDFPITEEMFYEQNTIERNTCARKIFIELHSPGSTFPDPKSFTQNSFLNRDKDQLDLLFRWKDMTAAEKHDEIQKILLDNNEIRVPRDNEPYAYAHLRLEGKDSFIWKGEDGEDAFQGFDPNNDPQSQIEYADRTDENDVEQDTKCAPIEGVPIYSWIPAIMCWLTEIQKTGIEFTQQCSLSLDDFNAGYAKDYERDISEIQINPQINPLLAGRENVINIEFMTSDGKPALGQRVYFTVTIEGAEPTSIVPDQDETEEGIQLSDADGQEQIEVIPSENIVKITVIAEYNGETLTATKELSVINNQKFTIIEKNVEDKDGIKAYTLSVSENQNFETFDEKIQLSISPRTEAILSQKEVSLGEEFRVAVRSDKEVKVSASFRGVEKATHILEGNDEFQIDVNDIILPALPKNIAFYKKIIIPIIFLNEMGSEIDSAQLPTATPEFDEFMEITPFEENGKYFLRIRTKERSGPANFSLSLGDVIKEFTFFEGSMISKNEFQNYNFNALYASITGFEEYGENLSNHFATKILHSSDILNVITTQIVAPKVIKPQARILSSGKIKSIESGYSPVIINSSPLQMGIYDEYESRYKGKFLLDTSSVSDIFLESPIGKMNGVFVEKKSNSEKIQIEKNGESVSIALNNIEIANISKSGNITIQDNNFLLTVDENSIDDGIGVFLENKNRSAIASITFKSAKWIEIGDSPFVSTVAGQDGFFITDGNQSTQMQELFPSFQTDFSQNRFGAGFQQREKYVLEYAAGNTVGESTKSTGGLFLLNIGDPSIAIPPPEKNSSGFDATVGKEIFASKNSEIKEVIALDFDGDGLKDLAKISQDGEVYFFTNDGNSNFQQWGNGVKIDDRYGMLGVMDRNADGFQDLVYSDRNGLYHSITNENGKFIIESSPDYLPDTLLNSGKMKDIDNDGNADIIGITKEGALTIWYGGADSTKGDEKIIDNYEFTIPENPEKNILISFKNIEKITSIASELIPLSFFSSKSQNFTIADLEEDLERKLYTFDEFAKAQTTDPISQTLELQNNISDEGDKIIEKLFAPFQYFNSSVSISKQMVIDDESSETVIGKKVLQKISITSKDTKPITITLADPYSDLLQIDKRSLKCENCGDKYDGAIFPITSNLIILEDIIIQPGQTVELSYISRIAKLPAMEISIGNLNDDDILDIVVSKRNNGALKYLSTGQREYERKNAETSSNGGLPDFLKNFEDSDGNGIPDKYETDADGDGIMDGLQEMIQYNDRDNDGDGVTNAWDKNLDGTDFEILESQLDEVIDFLASCKSGGCIDMPINYAFFVPGQPNVIAPLLANSISTGIEGVDSAINNAVENINDASGAIFNKKGLPSGFQPYVMTVYNSGPSGSFCVGPSCWQPCTWGLCPISYDAGFAMSTFRFYLSPTLTGGVGVVVCMGAGGSRQLPLGKCFIQAIPDELLGDFCEQVFGDFDLARQFSSLSSGEQLFQVESGYGGDNNNLLQYSLAMIDTSIPVAKNTRLNGGPGFFARWANRQIEELASIFSLPALTIYYPDIHNSFYNDDDEYQGLFSGFFGSRNYSDFRKDFLKNTSNESYIPNEQQKKEAGNNERKKRYEGKKGNGENIVDPSKDITNNVYDKLQPVNNFIENVDYQAESITDFYRMLEGVPLLNMQRTPVIIKYPNLTRKEVISKIADIDDWLENAKSEVSGLKNSQSDWDDVEKENIVRESEKIIKNMEKLKKSLEFYRDEAPRLLGDLDAEVAKYLYSIVCYMDAISELTGKWFLRNKIRYEKWLELFETLPEIMKSFQMLPQLFNGYQGYCETCKASNYNSDGFVVDLLGSFVPEPPIIQFPRMPDIVLDLSQINAAITIEVPELKIQSSEIRIPSFPPLLLPRVPTADFSLRFPKIPELPTFEIPKLPPFPDIPIPKLPDIPPPPLIPSFMADFGNLMGIIEKGLFLYCIIIRKGLFVYPEVGAMSVVETLTARPLKPLDMDFLSLHFPDIKLPSISEIEVIVEVNLEQDVDFITEYVQDFAGKLNNQTTNLLDGAKIDYGDLSDQLDNSNVLDRAGVEFQKGVDSIVDPINNESENIEDRLETEAENAQDDIDREVENAEESLEETLETKNNIIQNTISSIPKTNAGVSVWKKIMQKEKQKIEKSWENPDLISVSALRTKMGLPKWRPSQKIQNSYKNSFAISQYKEMKEEVVALQNFYETQSQKLFASQDISIVINDEIPAEKVYALEPDGTDVTQENVVEKISDTLPKSKSTEYGIFLKDDEGTVFRLMDYIDESPTITSFFFIDVNNDGEQDIIYSTPFEIFVKIRNNSNTLSHKKIYNGSIEKKSFSEVLPQFGSPKNLAIYGEGGKIDIYVLPESKETMAGILYVIDDALTHEYRNNGTQRQYIFQMKEEVFSELSENYETEKDLDFTENSLHIRNNDIAIDPDSIVRINKFDYQTFESPLEYNTVHSVRAYWILNDGSLGNISDHELLINSQADDESTPLIFESLNKDGYMYKENEITIDQFYDLDNPTNSFAWDTDRNGSYELQGNTYISPKFRIPTTEEIPFKLSDISGNSSEEIITITYKLPQLLLDTVKTDIVNGHISPRYEGVPVSLVRERFGVTKKIKDFIETDVLGKYEFSNFENSKNAIVKDNNGTIIAEVDAITGKLFSTTDEYRVAIIAGNSEYPLRQVLINAENKIIANVVLTTDTTYSVKIVSNFSDVWDFGTFITDVNNSDDFAVGPLPIDAPENGGGAVLFNEKTQTPIAMIYKTGNIKFFPNMNNFALQQKNNGTDKNLIIEILELVKGDDGKEYTRAVAEVLLQVNEEKIDIDFSKNATGIISQFSNTFQRIALLDISKFLAAENNFIPASSFSSEIIEKKENIKPFPFSDVSPNHSSYSAIANLYEKNMISGYSDDTFRPDEKISRAEFVQLALAVTDCLDCITPSEPEKKKYYTPFSFPDVFPKDWYDFCVSKAKKLSMIQGYGNGQFRPLQNISRAEAVAILLRQAEIPLELTSVEEVGDLPTTAWYYDYMITGINLGLVTPQIGFSFPNEQITRGEFAMMSERIFNLRDCRVVDSDRDGVFDYIEEFYGTDKNDANDFPKNSNTLKNPRDEILSDIPLDTTSGNIDIKSSSDVLKNIENILEIDENNNNIPDVLGIDENNNNIPDALETDENNNNIPDALETDENNNNIPDILEIDENNNNIPDILEKDDNNYFIEYITKKIEEKNEEVIKIIEKVEEKKKKEEENSVEENKESDNDLCPFVPEDRDGIDDEDGCPELNEEDDKETEEDNQEEVIELFKGDEEICGFLDYKADIREGDIVWSVILSDEKAEKLQEVYKKSMEIEVQ